VGFLADIEKEIHVMEAVAAEAKNGALRSERVGNKSAKRILLTGVSVGLGNDKVLKFHEILIRQCQGRKPHRSA
jgi:hypothetical protein